MSRLYGIWHSLGIARTRDISAIRSAYARILKSFDVDEDPARFATLRDARDQALAFARAAPDEDVDADEDEDRDEDWDEDWDQNGDQAWATNVPTIVPARPFAPIPVDPGPPPEPLLPATPDPAPAPASQEILLPQVSLNTPVLDLPADTGTLTAAADKAATLAAEMDRRYDAVVAILFPPGEHSDPIVADPDLAALHDHVATLLADPRMEQIAFREDADRWFANVLVQTIPRADPVLEQVAAAFGWMENRGRIDQPPAVAAIVARCAALRLVERLRSPAHPYNRAWRELNKPARKGSRKSFGVDGKKVRELLAGIRRNHPNLEGELDQHRVLLWDKPGVGNLAGNWLPWAIGIFLALFIIGLLDDRRPGSSPLTLSTTTPVTVPLLDRDADLNDILARVGGAALTMKTIEQRNPRLHGQLADDWRLARDKRVPRLVFDSDMTVRLVNRYNNGLRRGGYDLLADYWRFWLDTANAMRAHGLNGCADRSDLDQVKWRTPALIDRQRKLIGRTLLETDGGPRVEPRTVTFRLDQSVVDAAAKRSALPHDLFVKSINDGGTPDSRCTARIALIETALALPPKQGLPLLREI